jgi:hypothetical protein
MRFGVATYLWGKSEMAQNKANWQDPAPAEQATPPPALTEVEVLLNEVAAAADAAGVSRKQVSVEWAESHDGQFIGDATDVGGLQLLRDDLRRNAPKEPAA